MDTYVNIIACKHIGGEGLVNADAFYNSLLPIDKSRFLVRQALGISYLKLIYHNNLPLLINQYKSDIAYKFQQFELYCNNLMRHEDYNTMVLRKAINVCHFLLDQEGFPGLISQEDIIFFMSNDKVNIPNIGSPSFYEPYIHFLYTTSIFKSSDITADNGYVSKFNKEYPNPTIGVVDWYSRDVNLVMVNFPYFKFNCDAINTQHLNGLTHNTFLSYLACFDLINFNFKDLLKFIATYAVEFDDNVIDNNYVFFLKHLYNVMFDITSPKLSINNFNQKTIELFIGFIITIHNKYSIQIDDKQLLSRILFQFSQNTVFKNINEYLQAKGIEHIFAEQYNAFKKSLLGTISELDIATEAINKDKIVSNK